MGCVQVYALLVALERFFFTTTGFWLLRMALARLKAAWEREREEQQDMCKVQSQIRAQLFQSKTLRW